MRAVLRDGRPIRRRDVWVRRAGDENALIDPRNGAVHLLNATAQAVWELCDGETEPEEMIGAICELFSMDRDVVTKDVESVLAAFGTAKIVKWVP